MKIDWSMFHNPSSDFRAKPFWSLNGKLEKEELKRQILQMKDMGFGGAFLHSRTGLETKYMGEEWLSLMEYCVDVMSENGMQAYLYDEDRWPSGTCGGYVTMTKEYRAKSMVYVEITSPDTEMPENFLGLFAVTFDGDGKLQTGYRKIGTYAEAKPGERVFAFSFQYMLGESFYNGYTYVDTMNGDATNRFLELTHEKYKAKFGDRFGKDVYGIFQDEPHRGPLFAGFSRHEPNMMIEIPYTYSLFDVFAERKGYRLEERLPVLWFGKSGEPFTKEMYDYVEIVEELFLENFARPYYEWCRKNRLIATGHILHEDNLAAQTNVSGSVMRYFEYMDSPGMDNLGGSNYVYNVPALVSSAAKQLGKDAVLDELYGVSGWGCTLNDYKRIGDWQSAGGVTLRCPHLSWYTMKGEAKRDCPASLFHQSAWYKKFAVLEDYYARLTYLLKTGEDTTDIAIINPIESTWGLVNQYTFKWLTTTNDEKFQEIEREYAELYKSLWLNGLQADYIDEGLFAKYKGNCRDAFVCGKKSYSTVILNANLELRSTTLDAIREFVAGGGRVILVGDAPEYLDGVRHDFTEDLRGVTRIPFDMKALVGMLGNGDVTLSEEGFIVERRLFDGKVFLYILHREDEKKKVKITVRTDEPLVKIDLRSGDIEAFDCTFENGCRVFEKEFAPGEELALLCDDVPCANKAEKEYVRVQTPTEYAFTLKEDNMLVLNEATCSFDGKRIESKDVLAVDRDLRDAFGLERRNSEMIQPWFKEKFYPNKAQLYTRVNLTFEFESNVEGLPLKLMFEKDATLTAEMNGKLIDVTLTASSPIDICFAVADVPATYLQKGRNAITVSYDFYEKTNVEGCFLLGSFGVKNENGKKILTALPEKLTLGDLTAQGLWYFGGEIEMRAPLAKGNYRFATDKLDAAYLSVNGKDAAFSPFEAEFESDGELVLDLILNRQNSFGRGAEVGAEARPCGFLGEVKLERQV